MMMTVMVVWKTHTQYGVWSFSIFGPGDDDLRSLNTRQIIQRITGSRVFQESEDTGTAVSPSSCATKPGMLFKHWFNSSSIVKRV